MGFATEVTDVRLTGGIWGRAAARAVEKILPACLDRCDETGRIENFASAAADPPGAHQGRFYNDACLYKVIEGAANALAIKRDAALEQRVDGIIGLIGAAQQQDGYLNTYFQLERPGERWTDMSLHEMYCAGHLLEAGMAYLDATGKDTLYRVSLRFLEEIMGRFGPGKEPWVPGHEEIELALVKLGRRTGERRYYEFARWLIEQRGRGLTRNGPETEAFYTLEYNQDDLPLRDARQAKGHAVRAMYLYTAAADYERVTGDREYLPALRAIWEDVTGRKMYITGGIGSSRYNEGFSGPYDLPNLTAYCETCAAVGMVFWNQRMVQLTGEASYADVMERALYNGVLSGAGLDGRTFFYDNPLESDGSKGRSPWFTTSCCPTQLARFLPAVKNYLYHQSGDRLWVDLYAASRAVVRLDGVDVGVEQRTDYPYEGRVELLFSTRRGFHAMLCLRIPQWCSQWGIATSFTMQGCQVEDGYLVLDRRWEDGDRLELCFEMPVRVERAHDCVEADRGKVALMRGPLVYCLEELDNPSYDAASVPDQARFTVSAGEIGGEPTRLIGWESGSGRCTAIPYYLWNNRGGCRMKVWF